MDRSRLIHNYITSGMWTMLILLGVHFFVFPYPGSLPGLLNLLHITFVKEESVILILAGMLSLTLFPQRSGIRFAKVFEIYLIINFLFVFENHLEEIVATQSRISFSNSFLSLLLYLPAIISTIFYFFWGTETHRSLPLALITGICTYEATPILKYGMPRTTAGEFDHILSIYIYLFCLTLLMMGRRFKLWIRTRNHSFAAREGTETFAAVLPELKPQSQDLNYPRTRLRFIYYSTLIVAIITIFPVLYSTAEVLIQNNHTIKDPMVRYFLLGHYLSLSGHALLAIIARTLLKDTTTIRHSNIGLTLPAIIFSIISCKTLLRILLALDAPDIISYICTSIIPSVYPLAFAVAAFMSQQKFNRLALAAIACSFSLFPQHAFAIFPILLLILSISLWHRYRFLARYERIIEAEEFYSADRP